MSTTEPPKFSAQDIAGSIIFYLGPGNLDIFKSANAALRAAPGPEIESVWSALGIVTVEKGSLMDAILKPFEAIVALPETLVRSQKEERPIQIILDNAWSCQHDQGLARVQARTELNIKDFFIALTEYGFPQSLSDYQSILRIGLVNCMLEVSKSGPVREKLITELAGVKSSTSDIDAFLAILAESKSAGGYPGDVAAGPRDGELHHQPFGAPPIVNPAARISEHQFTP